MTGGVCGDMVLVALQELQRMLACLTCCCGTMKHVDRLRSSGYYVRDLRGSRF